MERRAVVVAIVVVLGYGLVYWIQGFTYHGITQEWSDALRCADGLVLVGTPSDDIRNQPSVRALLTEVKTSVSSSREAYRGVESSWSVLQRGAAYHRARKELDRIGHGQGMSFYYTESLGERLRLMGIILSFLSQNEEILQQFNPFKPRANGEERATLEQALKYVKGRVRWVRLLLMFEQLSTAPRVLRAAAEDMRESCDMLWLIRERATLAG